MKLEEFIELPKEEKEKIFGEATRKAIAETHAAGRPSCHGDNLGVYNLYPDGTKNILNYTKKDREKTPYIGLLGLCFAPTKQGLFLFLLYCIYIS